MSLSQMTQSTAAPSLFLSHGGGPAMFMNEGEAGMFKTMGAKSEFADFYRGLSSRFKRPAAIVIISAHWEEPHFTVNMHRGSESVPLLYDYSGFPERLYAPHFLYPAKSDKELEEKVFGLLAAEFSEKDVRRSASPRGFDHGVFIPLKIMYPSADVPVVQVSLCGDLDFQKHYRLGRALSPLLAEGVLVLGSGQTTHNLGAIGNTGFSSSATSYCKWLSDTLLLANSNPAESRSRLVDMMSSSDAKRMHPRTEHILPLIVAFGAAFPDACSKGKVGLSKVTKIYSDLVLSSLSLDSYLFAPTS